MQYDDTDSEICTDGSVDEFYRSAGQVQLCIQKGLVRVNLST